MWRAALIALCLAAPAAAQEISDARYHSPTRAYPHGVLGDDLEWSGLQITVTTAASATSRTYELPAGQDMVYEDTAPRLWDMTGDGIPEVIAVQSHQSLGARLVVIGLKNTVPKVIAATPHIGTRFRWLAPVGAADLDGDGHIEIAYVDRPHLAKTLRVWRYANDRFSQIASLPGLSNHRIGEDFITGGLRDCGTGAELVLPDARWRNIMSVRMTTAEISSVPLGPFSGPASVTAALACN